MKIAPIYKPMCRSRMTFKGQDDSGVLVPDNDATQSVRDRLRKGLENKLSLYNVDTFIAEPRMEEKPLKDLESKFGCKKQTFVDDEKLRAIGLSRLESIGNNSYRGSMLGQYVGYDKVSDMKDAGITQIVDLTSNERVEKACKKAKVNYFKPPTIYENDQRVQTEEEMRDYYLKYYRGQGYDETQVKQLTEESLADWRENVRVFINKFVKYIQIMQKGHLYIGCFSGTCETDRWLYFDSLFNPKAVDHETKHMGDQNEAECIRISKRIYEKLTEEDKKKMGWTKEFEEGRFFMQVGLLDS